MKTTELFKDRQVETSPHKNKRAPSMLYINLDERCNENCVFCVVKGANLGKFGSMDTEEVKRIIDEFIKDGGIDVVFTGGEPTLKSNLPEIIQYAEQFTSTNSISIITNGTGLANKKYLESLIDSDKKNKMSFSISLHSHRENVSELLTGTKGTYKKTIAGIENVIKKERGISIYHVITSKNYKDLFLFVKFIHKKYPQIRNVTFAYPFPQGNAVLNDWLFAKISSLRPYFIKALQFLEENNYRVDIASCGQFPLCALPGFEEKVLDSLFSSEENITGVVGEKSFHEFEMMSDEWIDQYKNKNIKCKKCILNKYCQGFWKKYIDLFEFDGLHPISQKNFKGNKIHVSLKSNKYVKSVIDLIKNNKLNLIILKDYSENTLKQLTEIIINNKILAVIVFKNTRLYPI